MSEFWDRYSGKRAVLGEALFHHDPYDQFAWCQEWRFAIADYLTFNACEPVAGFEPSLFGPDRESYAYDTLCGSPPPIEALRYAETILDRYREWLRIAGKDY